MSEKEKYDIESKEDLIGTNSSSLQERVKLELITQQRNYPRLPPKEKTYNKNKEREKRLDLLYHLGIPSRADQVCKSVYGNHTITLTSLESEQGCKGKGRDCLFRLKEVKDVNEFIKFGKYLGSMV
ncbi:hypothetical protein J6590_053866 [Homalodisca vitripennis]|nr:hypothetical protein J6590_053866 [Homalodisca vitripennis]